MGWYFKLWSSIVKGPDLGNQYYIYQDDTKSSSNLYSQLADALNTDFDFYTANDALNILPLHALVNSLKVFSLFLTPLWLDLLGLPNAEADLMLNYDFQPYIWGFIILQMAIMFVMWPGYNEIYKKSLEEWKKVDWNDIDWSKIHKNKVPW